MYSFGLVVYEMLTNKLPFEDIHEFALINRVGVQGERPELPDRPTAAALQVGVYKLGVYKLIAVVKHII